jgi:long-chain acyl-CoA synthetase
VVRPGTNLEDLIAHMREHLPAHKRPASYQLVEELPRTATGKLLRRSLAALATH